MLLHRTEKARLELQPGVRNLSQKERSLLLLANGRTALHELGPMFEGEGEQIVLRLVEQGYLTATRQAATPPVAAGAPVPGNTAPAQAAPAAAAADAFEGKRSLATTRMFLFDICERMFARRDPEMAARIREALRGAKDRESMLAAGREMLAEVERVAGPDRADAISQRIAMLLPPETADS